MKKYGFTLIELLGVIAILGILILAVVPNVIKIYNNSVLKTMSVQESNVKNASKLFVEDYCVNPIDNTYNCPLSFKNAVSEEKYVCLNDLQSGTDKYIGSVTYKKEECTGVIIYTKNESGSYNESKTYLYCGYDDDTGSYSYMTDSLVDVSKYLSCNIMPQPTNRSCFAFNSSTGTITDYYYFEDNNSSNPACTRDVIIPSKINGVTVNNIGDHAFQQNQLTSVTIPNTVTSIGNRAFQSNQLTSIIIPNSVTTIQTQAFQLNQISSATIPNSVQTIGQYAFSNNKLTSIEIPSSVTNIINNPFTSNPTLTSLTVDNNNSTYISSNNAVYTKDGKTLVSGTKTSSESILNTTTTIRAYAFDSMGLTSITIPSSVTSLGAYSLYYNQLTSVTIPNSVTSIDNMALAGNLLASISISNNLTNIINNPFSYNQLLTNITVDSNNPTYMSSNNAIYTKDGKTLISGTKTSSNSILNTTITINPYAFYFMSVTTLTIPSSVINIESYAFYVNQLTTISIPTSVINIGNSAFGHNQLTSVTIPSSVTTIEPSSFIHNQLTNVTIPINVTSLGTWAFRENQLTNVYIKGKSSSAQFNTYGNDIWGWASGYSDSNITWNAP
jgi:prepilin-type N-terminal cleavage/methylation domain-containing protein